MKVLRILLLLLLAPICLLGYDLLATLCEHYAMPMKHGMLGFGIHIQFTGWFFAFMLPLCIFLGNMWWTDRRRYLPHLALLVALVFWSMNVWGNHPKRTFLFSLCCWVTLALRWLIDRMTIAR